MTVSTTLNGGTGNDLLQGQAGIDLLHGDDGNDTLFAGNDAFGDALYGDGGNDVLHSGTGTFGGANLYGGDGDDTLYGESADGYALLHGGAGNDSLVGSAGISYAVYSTAPAAVTISLALTGPQNTGSAGIDTLTGIDGVMGSAFDDQLTGNDNSNFMEGGAGNDTLDGGAGDDSALYINAGGGVTVNLAISGPQNTGGAGYGHLAEYRDRDRYQWLCRPIDRQRRGQPVDRLWRATTR